jgi:hypothetical protein
MMEPGSVSYAVMKFRSFTTANACGRKRIVKMVINRIRGEDEKYSRRLFLSTESS